VVRGGAAVVQGLIEVLLDGVGFLGLDKEVVVARV